MRGRAGLVCTVEFMANHFLITCVRAYKLEALPRSCTRELNLSMIWSFFKLEVMMIHALFPYHVTFLAGVSQKRRPHFPSIFSLISADAFLKPHFLLIA